MKRNQKKPWLIGVTVTLALAGVVFLLTRPLTASEAAERAVAALMAGDAHRLYALAPTEEREALQLSAGELDALSERIFRPRTRAIKSWARGQTNEFRPSAQAHASATVELEDGRRITLTLQANGRESGATAPFSYALLQIWALDYHLAHAQAPTGLAVIEEGIESDRAELEALGVSGMFNQTRQEIEPFDEFLARLRRLMRRSNSSATPAGEEP